MTTAMFTKIGSETRDVTPALAAEFATMPGSPTERPLDRKRLNYLHGQFMNGSAVAMHWATAELDGITYRVNGQTSSAALNSMNGEMPPGLIAHIDRYRVENIEGLAYLFRQFDHRKSARSVSDVAGAYQGIVTNLHNVPRASAKRALDGIVWYLSHVEGVPTPTGDDAYDKFNDPQYHDFIIWQGQVQSVKTPELQSNGVIAAMYGTFLQNEEDAKTFWREVARGGDDYNEKAPSSVLDEWLKGLKEKASLRDKVKDGQRYQACVFAWNAHRGGKTFEKIKFDTKKGFFDIE